MGKRIDCGKGIWILSLILPSLVATGCANGRPDAYSAWSRRHHATTKEAYFWPDQTSGARLPVKDYAGRKPHSAASLINDPFANWQHPTQDGLHDTIASSKNDAQSIAMLSHEGIVQERRIPLEPVVVRPPETANTDSFSESSNAGPKLDEELASVAVAGPETDMIQQSKAQAWWERRRNDALRRARLEAANASGVTLTSGEVATDDRISDVTVHGMHPLTEEKKGQTHFSAATANHDDAIPRRKTSQSPTCERLLPGKFLDMCPLNEAAVQFTPAAKESSSDEEEQHRASSDAIADLSPESTQVTMSHNADASVAQSLPNPDRDAESGPFTPFASLETGLTDLGASVDLVAQSDAAQGTTEHAAGGDCVRGMSDSSITIASIMDQPRAQANRGVSVTLPDEESRRATCQQAAEWLGPSLIPARDTASLKSDRGTVTPVVANAMQPANQNAPPPSRLPAPTRSIGSTAPSGPGQALVQVKWPGEPEPESEHGLIDGSTMTIIAILMALMGLAGGVVGRHWFSWPGATKSG